MNSEFCSTVVVPEPLASPGSMEHLWHGVSVGRHEARTEIRQDKVRGFVE
jgi:hypothetical protein